MHQRELAQHDGSAPLIVGKDLNVTLPPSPSNSVVDSLSELSVEAGGSIFEYFI